ncbi:MAG: hypothetical protein L0Z53_14215, partial [Acidobacteriales bacterium]|nr:hypothetical protein [Terriglobales bacterium]
TGKIVDEEGAPVQDANVTVNVYQGRGEKRRLSPRQSGQTNDLGEYRIYGLDAGKYYLRATPRRDYSAVWGALRGPEKRTRKSEQTETSAYPPLFYPGALDVSQATRIELKPGDEMRADFTFAPVQAFSVRGHVVGALPKSTDPVVVVLSAKSGRGEDQQAGRVRNDGSYEIADVLPGSYRLSVSAGDSWGNPSLQTNVRTVEVTNSDVNGIDLAVPTLTKAELRGRVSIEGDPTASLDRISLQLMPADDDDNEKRYGFRRAQVNSDGTFAFQQVSPGTYAVATSGGFRPGRGQYVKSVRFGTREVVETGFTVTEGTQPRLEVVLSSATGRIEGVVLDDKEQPVGGVDVLAIPRGSQHIRRFGFRVSGTDKNGGFVLPHLRPGQYRLYAFERSDYTDYRDDEFLSEHESESVTADAQVGNTAKVKLKLISLEEEDKTADLE